jgi:hypothetical protein
MKGLAGPRLARLVDHGMATTETHVRRSDNKRVDFGSERTAARDAQNTPMGTHLQIWMG